MIRQPSAPTLRKYGLSLADWKAILARQGGCCAVCGQIPSTGRLVIDHEHVARYKKLSPEKRRARVRGLLDWYCNHAYVGRGITVEKARGVVRYLEAYEERKNGKAC